jgi:hypothetical protein
MWLLNRSSQELNSATLVSGWRPGFQQPQITEKASDFQAHLSLIFAGPQNEYSM